MRKKPTARPPGGKTRGRISRSALGALIDEATIDCYNESEQATGLFTMMEEHLAVPFETTVVGVEAVVQRVDIDAQDVIVAIYHAGDHRQRVPILDLTLPSPPPAGAEWIEAYRCWLWGR